MICSAGSRLRLLSDCDILRQPISEFVHNHSLSRLWVQRQKNKKQFTAKRKPRPGNSGGLQQQHRTVSLRQDQEELQLGLQVFLENLLLGMEEERREVVGREAAIRSSSSDSSYLGLQGVLATGLEVRRVTLPELGPGVELELGVEPGMEPSLLGWKRGQLVTIEQSWGGQVDGILVKAGLDSLVVSVNTVSGWAGAGPVRLISRSQQKVFRQQLRSLKQLIRQEVDQMRAGAGRVVFSSLLGEALDLDSEWAGSHPVTLLHQQLQSDPSKMAVLASCAQRPHVTLIHGPPGTGKTTVLAAAVVSAVMAGDRVLVVAPSHAACDAVTLALAAHWPRQYSGQLTRLANPLRLTDSRVSQFLPDQTGGRAGLERELREVRAGLMSQQRGLGGLLERERELVTEYRREEAEQEERAVEAAAVVVCTLATAARPVLLDRLASRQFPLLCCDEAGFSLDAALLPLVCKAERLVLAGDHQQLPPVLHSPAAVRRGLAVSLLERLAAACPDWVCLLTTQYRSHPALSGWSSAQFYQGKLAAHPSLAGRCLRELPGLATVKSDLLDSPLVWLDTTGTGWTEDTEEGGSFSNSGEAVVVAELVEMLLKFGLDQQHLAVISPYWGQVGLVRGLLWEGAARHEVEVGTVDGFQGREKEAVVVSLVRSNSKGEVGFLQESRRMNVTVTRARRCCILVGDSSTLTADPACRSLWQYCSQWGYILDGTKLIL